MTVLDLDAVHKAYPGGVQALRGEGATIAVRDGRVAADA